jgi:DNA-binding NtrC family response regulator
MPVGADRPVSVDVRVVSATNRDLEALVGSGEFRDDLYWRLRGVELELPPLRDRHDDIILLATAFLAQSGPLLGRPKPPRLSRGARQALQDHAWPGNLRELKHAVRRGAVMAGHAEEIQASDLGLQATDRSQGAPASLAAQVERVERRAIRQALVLEGGNKSRVARRLGLSRQGLANKLARYGLS